MNVTQQPPKVKENRTVETTKFSDRDPSVERMNRTQEKENAGQAGIVDWGTMDYGDLKQQDTAQKTTQSYEVSPNGKTTLRSSGESVTIRDITSIQDGEMRLLLSNGKEVDSEQIAYANEGEAAFYQTIASMQPSPEAAKRFLKDYKAKKGTTAAAFAYALRETFQYGQENKLQSILKYTPHASKLTPGQQDYAYRRGKDVGTQGDTWKNAQALIGEGNASTELPAEQTDAYYEHWSKAIGASESIKTLADYYEMMYNRPNEFKLLKQYAKDVESGWISPISGFENYKNLYGRVQTEIVGKTAVNGILITGQVPHFIQRVVGTAVDPGKLEANLQIIRRSGVEVDDIISAVFNPTDVGEVQTRASGQRSVKIFGEKCIVTINPDTGELIQTNPL